MIASPDAPPPTGSDLLPALEELQYRRLANIREGRILRDLIRVAKKDRRIANPTGRTNAHQAQAVAASC